MSNAQWGVVILIVIMLLIGVGKTDVSVWPKYLAGGGVLAIVLIWLASVQGGLALSITGLLLFGMAIQNPSAFTSFVNVVTFTKPKG